MDHRLARRADLRSIAPSIRATQKPRLQARRGRAWTRHTDRVRPRVPPCAGLASRGQHHGAKKPPPPYFHQNFQKKNSGLQLSKPPHSSSSAPTQKQRPKRKVTMLYTKDKF